MKKSCCSENIKGFTLIEVLVVVLIIGILAAIALPQYQKAVLKTRFAEMQTMVRTLDTAMASYYLEHGDYPHALNELEINFDSLTHNTALAQSFDMADAYVKGDQYGLFTNGIGLSGAILFGSGYPFSGFITWNREYGFEPGKMYCAEFYTQTGFCEKFYNATPFRTRGTEYYYTMH